MSHEIPYKIIVTAKNSCASQKAGDTFTFLGNMLFLDPELAQRGVCFAALKAISCFIDSMKYGATPAFLKGKDVYEACCPDPRHLVTFEIKRVKISKLDDPLT